MRPRPVGADELDLSVEATGSPDHRKEVRRYLQSMFATGAMRPGWCFVAQAEEDRPQFQNHPEKRVELLESVGFAFGRETDRFEWRGAQL